eukprot:6211393-Pleurochrysis_carterae.AAC.2
MELLVISYTCIQRVPQKAYMATTWAVRGHGTRWTVRSQLYYVEVPKRSHADSQSLLKTQSRLTGCLTPAMIWQPRGFKISGS